MVDSARNAALFALNRADKDKSWSSAIINSISAQYKLDDRDTAFFSRLVLSTIENKKLCDFYLDYFCKDRENIDITVRNILRMSLCQILFFDRVPNHAAVDSAVELCKQNKCRNAAGFVNAILRKITSNISNLPSLPNESDSEYLSIKYSHPIWLAEYLVEKFGTHFTEEFFIANNSIVPLYIHTNTLKISTDDLIKYIENNCELEVSRHDYVSDILLINNSGDITRIPGFNEGLFFIQDPAAAQSILISCIKPNMNVLDACSAPGGKSLSSALLMNNCGSILSCDIHEKKLNLINQSAKRLGVDIINTCARDARVVNEKEYDVVIADVPCSGIGVIRKKPEIREKSKAEIDRLPDIQLDILESCSSSVKSGGTLLYTTCTVIEEENDEIVKKFLSNHSNFVLCDFEINNKVVNGYYTFWPHIDKTDGFFVCKMKRIN